MSSGTSDLVAASSLDTYIRALLFFFYIPTFFYNYYSVCDITGTREGVKQRRLEKFYGYNTVAYDQSTFTHTQVCAQHARRCCRHLTNPIRLYGLSRPYLVTLINAPKSQTVEKFNFDMESTEVFDIIIIYIYYIYLFDFCNATSHLYILNGAVPYVQII